MPAVAAKRSRRAARPANKTFTRPLPRTEGGLAVELIGAAREAGPAGLVHLTGTEARAERLAGLVWALAPEIETFFLPPWDCLPFDRSSPSSRSMGLRVAALSALARPGEGARLVLATSEALIQRVPPRTAWADSTRSLSVGDLLDLDDLAKFLGTVGYASDERVDEPGEFALRGAVVDIFPAGYYLPVRIDHEEGRIKAIASFDAASQRTTDAFETLHVRPVSEAILPPDAADAPRPPGLEHRLPELYERLETLLDYLPDARLSVEPGAIERQEAFLEQVRDGYEVRQRYQKGERPLAPERLYRSADEVAGDPRQHDMAVYASADESEREVPSFALGGRPKQQLRSFVTSQQEAGRRILLAGPDEADLDEVVRGLASNGAEVSSAESWDEVLAAPAGALLRKQVGIGEGFRAEPGITVIATADALGSRAAQAPLATLGGAAESVLGDDGAFRVGDAVIHLDHGVGCLVGLESVPAGAEVADTIRLEYAGDAKLMVPVGDVELMWRYGPMREGLSLDRLGSDSWPKRRAKVEGEIAAAASALARLAADREKTAVAPIAPPRRDYERFVSRFPFSATADQNAAVDAVLADLKASRPMDRLVCGDVGFGKTEVALRAAAAVALSGKQVALAAPTTVLVRQHLETFRRRFADFGIEVAGLSRLSGGAEAKAVKEGLKDGRIRVVIGTHALAGRGVAFADLGLLIVDEEQRFGAADKEKLRRLGRGVHVLAMTATPIPRTLQGALAGLQDVSVLATPPAERQPVRTFVSPLDLPTMRDALMRERRRGGQSFLVCPRIEDLDPMAARLKEVVPELDVKLAHGKLKVDELDRTMVEFANGEGDLLLATNIIESGLDVPRANTIMIWRADLFGLAQLHQLRGRVGRGRVRGIAYLLTDPEAEPAPETLRRLETLASLDRLGAGFEISAEDLETRGAGDLLGDSQAGHVKLIGAGLYRRLLERAIVIAKGLDPADEWTPELNVGLSGRIPAEYVPEAEVRLNLYARIARSRGEADQARLVDEIEDRFGPLPSDVFNLLGLARARDLCRKAEVARVDAGPQAIALTFKVGRPDAGLLRALQDEMGGELAWKGERLVFGKPTENGERLEALTSMLAHLHVS